MALVISAQARGVFGTGLSPPPLRMAPTWSSPSTRARQPELRSPTLPWQSPRRRLTLISVSRLRGDCQGSVGDLNSGCLARVLGDDHVGAILSGGGESPVPNTPRAWAEMTNAIQQYAL